jgi:RNA polymerase sigma factor (sigma-70 family)
MSNPAPNSVLHHVRRLAAVHAGGRPSDQDLLSRFVRDRDEAAFAALVERHAGLVLGVCRRLLRHAHDAEDACQATFLVLARRAATIRKQASLASWLHGVAFRAAANLRRTRARRSAHETALAEPPATPPADVTWREVQAVLDEELARLPERLRAPLVLCYLEGRTRDEAAQLLGWSPGALRGRLERGRERLRARLTRRGLALPTALLAALLPEQGAAAPAPRRSSTRRSGGLSGRGRSVRTDSCRASA